MNPQLNEFTIVPGLMFSSGIFGSGQVRTGAVAIKVEDTSVAVVPETTTTISNSENGISLICRTDQNGCRKVRFLRRGLYYVTTRKGNFSNHARNGRSVIRPYNPSTTTEVNGQLVRQRFSGNVIPSSKTNPAGARVVSTYPLPNAPGNFDNYFATADRGVDDNGGTIRVDHVFISSELRRRNLNTPRRRYPCHEASHGSKAVCSCSEEF